MSPSEFKGKPLVDIRVYYRTDDGDWLPTKKGITLRTKGELDKVVVKLQELRGVLGE